MLAKGSDKKGGYEEPTSPTAIGLFIVVLVFIILCIFVFWLARTLLSGGPGASF